MSSACRPAGRHTKHLSAILDFWKNQNLREQLCQILILRGESVNRPQMDINIKHVIFEPGKKHLILDISFINIDTLVPSLYQCVETRSIEVF
jgi:hypothetical protein